MTQPNYAVIVGQGRSGTNWLLDLLDFSPLTYCRNEPDKLPACLLNKLPSPVVCQPFDESFGQQWDEAIKATASRIGERDRVGYNSKAYLVEPMRKIGGKLLLDKPRVRQLFSGIMPSWTESEWSIPWWYVNSSAFEQALPIFKLNQVPAWSQWVLQHRPNALVIHIVRHPGGFLNSWKKRYLSTQKLEDTKQANEERLQKIAQTDSEWAEKFGNIETMTVEESELWYWCYANEMIYRAGHGLSNYIQIIYEKLVLEPLVTTKLVYEQCGLPLSKDIEDAVSQSSSISTKISKAWSKNLLPNELALIQQFLSNSLMGQWWTEFLNES